MSRGTILLRVDGSAEAGMGRVARCLALANALQRRRYQMTFVTQIDNTTWPDRIRRFRHGVAKTPFAAGTPDDREFMIREVGLRNPVVVVTDSPEIDEEYLALLTNRVPLLISLDEFAAHRFPSDLVLNPTLCASPDMYRMYPGSQLVTGSKYVMIRSEFRRARNVRATEPSGPPRILISLGAGDGAAETMGFAKALLKIHPQLKVDAVLGVKHDVSDQIAALKDEHRERLTIATDVRDLGIRMTKSHLLITGGGNTALEAACVGIPMVLVTRHERHRQNAERLEEIGVAQYLGHKSAAAPAKVAEAVIAILEDNFEKKAMTRSGRMLIDGRGPDRLVTATEVLLCRSRKVKSLAA